MAEFKTMIEKDYGIKVRPITTRNPQSDAILQRVHQTIGSMAWFLMTKTLGMVASTMFSLRATVHTTTQHTPAQLVFNRDSIRNVSIEANWKLIKQHKQALINKANERENKLRKDHTYNIGDKVLLKNVWPTKFNQDAFLGPYVITAVRNNGTVRARKGRLTDRYNICNLVPFRE